MNIYVFKITVSRDCNAARVFVQFMNMFPRV